MSIIVNVRYTWENLNLAPNWKQVDTYLKKTVYFDYYIFVDYSSYMYNLFAVCKNYVISFYCLWFALVKMLQLTSKHWVKQMYYNHKFIVNWFS